MRQMAKMGLAVVLILLLDVLGFITPNTPAVAAPDEVKWSRVNIPAGISSIIDVAISPRYSWDNTLFMLTWSGEHSLWRSLNGGTIWESIYSSTLPDVDIIDKVELSPQYGNGSQVVFIAGSSHGNPAIWRSTDNGQNFDQPRLTQDPTTSAAFTIDTWAVVNDNTLFIGSFDGINGLVYHTIDSGLSYSTGAVAGSQPLNSIALSPDYTQDETILVGNTNGWVYWSGDDGISFEPVPLEATSPSLVGSIAVAFDPQFSSNNTIYAASNTPGNGIYRFIIGRSTEWEGIDSPADGMIGQLMVSADGTLYATNFKADGGMERCLNPTFHLTPTFETVTRGLDDGAKLNGLWLHGNQLWSIDTTDARLMTYTDSLAVPVTLTSPVNQAPGIGTIINYEIISVTLDWEVLAGATKYHWQLDYDRDFSSVPTGFESDTGASSARLPSLEPATRYYWRVRVIEPVLSRWSPKWSFTTSISAPTLYSPEAGASGVELKPLFQWSSTPWATSYELLVSTNDSFSSPLISMSGSKALPTTAWQCDTELDYNTTYYWKVKAIGSDTYSPWSDTGIFTTISEPTIPLLEPPLLLAPSPGATDVWLTPSFAWSGANWATGYEFILAEDNNFIHQVIAKVGTNALPAAAWLCSIDLDYHTTYYWKVRAVGSDSYSPWSDTGIFTTIPEPTILLEPPLLQAPSPGAGDIWLTPSFAWSGADWATGYEFILAIDDKFDDEVITKAGNKALPTTAWLCDTELDYNMTYYWKVRAMGSDSYSPWSDTGIFTTIPEPTILLEPPLLLAPSPGAGDIWLTPSFAWSGADWATGYEFILAEDDIFRGELVNRTSTDALKTNAYLCEEDLDYHTTYYWKVRAMGFDSYSPWSGTGIFTTISEPTILLEPPLLQAPSPGAGDIWLTPSFAWSGADWATDYEFILAEDNKFADEVITKAGSKALPTTAWLCDIELDYHTVYYWKVRATGSDSYSPWSDTGIFTTIPEPTIPLPETPILQAPSPGAYGVCLTPSFAWSGADWATSYEFVLAKDNKFADKVMIKAGNEALPTTAWQCDIELDYHTVYYWKVRSIWYNSYGQWSDTGIFTTIPQPTIPDWLKWLIYLGIALLLIMVAILIALIIFGVKIMKPLSKYIGTIKGGLSE